MRIGWVQSIIFQLTLLQKERCKISPSLQASHLIFVLKIKFSFRCISLEKKYSVANGIILRCTQLDLQIIYITVGRFVYIKF
jgi:hypothetical protein